MEGAKAAGRPEPGGGAHAAAAADSRRDSGRSRPQRPDAGRAGADARSSSPERPVAAEKPPVAKDERPARSRAKSPAKGSDEDSDGDSESESEDEEDEDRGAGEGSEANAGGAEETPRSRGNQALSRIRGGMGALLKFKGRGAGEEARDPGRVVREEEDSRRRRQDSPEESARKHRAAKRTARAGKGQIPAQMTARIIISATKALRAAAVEIHRPPRLRVPASGILREDRVEEEEVDELIAQMQATEAMRMATVAPPLLMHTLLEVLRRMPSPLVRRMAFRQWVRVSMTGVTGARATDHLRAIVSGMPPANQRLLQLLLGMLDLLVRWMFGGGGV